MAQKKSRSTPRRPETPGAIQGDGSQQGSRPEVRGAGAPRIIAAPEFTSGAAQSGAEEHYVLTLYVTGATAGSLRAIANMKTICEQYLKGRYLLEVVDIHRQPDLLRRDQIVAVPTLIKRLPTPLRLLVGDLSRTEQVLQGLGLVSHAS